MLYLMVFHGGKLVRFLTFTRLQQIGIIVLSCTAMLASGIIISQGMAEKRTPSVRFVPEDTRENTGTQELLLKNKTTQQININTASAGELMSLPRVGSCTAARIIEYRKRHGKFICVKELLNVKGIGPKTLAKIQEGICIGTNSINHSDMPPVQVSSTIHGTKTGSVATPKMQKQRFPININIASASELEALPGIGPAKARAILDYRNTQGLFQKIEDITMVKGIGEKIFEQIKLLITTGEVFMPLQDTQGAENPQP